MGELGVKLAIGDTFVIPPLFEGGDTAVAMVTDLPELELGSIYHDTVDLRLARSGVTLRYRIGDEGGPCWSLKLPVPDGQPGEHEELSFAGGPADIPAAAKDLVSAWSRRGHLAPAAALSTRRRRWRLADRRWRTLWPTSSRTTSPCWMASGSSVGSGSWSLRAAAPL